MLRSPKAFLFIVALAVPAHAQEARPNILWITSEDNGPHLGAYGDRYATTPHLDRLATQGLRYVSAWSNAPVCAPARTTIISGLYPSSTGAEHMRSLVQLPGRMRMFPALLRQAGYYTANNAKEDYNLAKTPDVWDDSSPTAHWRNRQPGQPFFAVFNLMESHESFIQRRPAPKAHDPAQVRLPAYHPDTPEVRADWAAYYDNLTVVDRKVGERLAELDAAGLADDTIVIYFGDHGAGMPRSKRWPYNSGLRVPILLRVPAKFRHLAPAEYAAGATSSRLVGFVDLAPTMLSAAGLEPPAWMQGQAFLGRHMSGPPAYAFGLRGRIDERYDLVRTVRDQRYVYIRNYMPHRIYGQHLWYMFLLPSTNVWKRLYDEGRLAPPQTFFWETKPVEELYDLQSDPDEVKNLASSSSSSTAAKHRPILERFRRALDEHARRIRDVGFLPEYALHRMKAPDTPYDLGHDPTRYDLEAVRAMASKASDTRILLSEVRRGLSSPDEAVRWWTATGMIVRGREAVPAVEADLVSLLADRAPAPRIAAAEALARFGSAQARARAIDVLLQDADAGKQEEYVNILALNALVQVSDLPAPARTIVEHLPTAPSQSDQRENYIQHLVREVINGLR